MNIRIISIVTILVLIIGISILGLSNNNNIKEKYISKIDSLEVETDKETINAGVKWIDIEFKKDRKYLVLYQNKNKVEELNDTIESIVIANDVNDRLMLKKELLRLKEYIVDFNEKELPTVYNIL